MSVVRLVKILKKKGLDAEGAPEDIQSRYADILITAKMKQVETLDSHHKLLL